MRMKTPNILRRTKCEKNPEKWQGEKDGAKGTPIKPVLAA
jgi:hypothetical protein